MPWFDFFWYDYNIQHLADNDVTPEEFEEIVMQFHKFDASHSGSDMVAGTTAAGRYIVCLFVMIDRISILPLTAYCPTKGNE